MGEGECTRLVDERGRRLPILSGKVGASTLIPALLPSREKGSDSFGQSVRIIERLLIAEAKDTVVLGGEPSIANSVTKLGIGIVMPSAIELDEQTGSQMSEVGDIGTDRNLPPEARVKLAQSLPEPLLRHGHLASQIPGPSNSILRIALHPHAP